MPNTEVKLQHAESSWGIAPCKGRTLPRESCFIRQALLLGQLNVNQTAVDDAFICRRLIGELSELAEGAPLEMV